MNKQPTESTTTTIDSDRRKTIGPFPLSTLLDNSLVLRENIAEEKTGVPLQAVLQRVMLPSWRWESLCEVTHLKPVSGAELIE